MRKFNQNSGKKSGRSRNRRDSGRSGSNRFNRRSSGRNRRDSGSFEKQMHKVICDKCGQSCEVPFKPTGGKPVYCSDCFRKEDNQESRSGYGRSRPKRPESRQESSELQQINAKLDKILEILNDD